jgi:hypothetical protein
VTEPRRRSAWRALADEWDPDHPAIARMREALKPPPVPEAPQPRQQAKVAPDTSPEPVEVPDPSLGRRARISDLIARVRAGDVSAVDLLRKSLDR